jgi:hypothetical protein
MSKGPKDFGPPSEPEDSPDMPEWLARLIEEANKQDGVRVEVGDLGKLSDILSTPTQPVEVLPPAETVEEEVECALKVDIVNVDTPLFSGKIISMYEMPGGDIIKFAFGSSNDALVKTVDMFKLALIDPAHVEMVALLPFHQLTEALQQWAIRSEGINRGHGL